MHTRISKTGRLVIPAKLRNEDRIAQGDRFEITKVGAGEYLLKRVEEAPNKGLVDWLLACPVKGFFQPIPNW